VTLDDLRPGLRHTETIRVSEALAVPAQAQLFDPSTEMPPVFATAQMIAFVEWACVHALAPYLAPHQRTVGTRVEMTHTAATPVGMRVIAEIELVEIDDRYAGTRSRRSGRGFTSARSSTMRGLSSGWGGSGPARGRAVRGRDQPALARAMPSPTYADMPSSTVAALIRIPFMGRCSSVRFCVALRKKPSVGRARSATAGLLW
jgi:predicted thioesterase